MKKVLLLDPADDVAVAVENIYPRDRVSIHSVRSAGGDDDQVLMALESIPCGHKIAVNSIMKGSVVRKYGSRIGTAVSEIKPGQHVHTATLKTALDVGDILQYEPRDRAVFTNPATDPEVSVFRRNDGRCGIRNEIWVVPTVGCVNGIADQIVREVSLRIQDEAAVDGVSALTHPYGCSQLGDDHDLTRALLQNIVRHPNAGGVLVLGLGCENNQVDVFRETLGEYNKERVRFLEIQQVEDELSVAISLIDELVEICRKDTRIPGRLSEIIFGLECGGSDGFSGITANNLIGMFSDYITGMGGTSLLTEVPEMFGAEHQLAEQCETEDVFKEFIEMIDSYKEYYRSHDQPIYENPSPGNKRGGITTLEEKSLGCIRKAGNNRIVDILKIDDCVTKQGLQLIASPGNDIVATTVLGTAGCQLVLFSTGRGTPLGGFIPTLKISTNSLLAERKPHWIDFDAGVLLNADYDIQKTFNEFIHKIVSIVNGEQTTAEKIGMKEIAIFKSGITL